MLIYQEFLALNEEMPAFNPNERLRWAVHEIMIRLKDGETIKFKDMCKILKDEFKIDIDEDLLKDIFDKFDKFDKSDYTFFKKEDKNWMDPFCFQGYVRRKCRDKQSFGKHRKREFPTTGGRSTYPSTYTPAANTYSGYYGDWGLNSTGYWKGDEWIPYNQTAKKAKGDERFQQEYPDYQGD